MCDPCLAPGTGRGKMPSAHRQHPGRPAPRERGGVHRLRRLGGIIVPAPVRSLHVLSREGDMGKVLVTATLENLDDLFSVRKGLLADEQVRRVEVNDAL